MHWTSQIILFYISGLSVEQMNELGIYTRLDQVFDAPDAVKEVLISQCGLDRSVRFLNLSYYCLSNANRSKPCKLGKLNKISHLWRLV